MRGILAALIVLSCVILSLSASGAADAPTVSVEPSSYAVLEGDTFIVNVTVNPQGEEIFGAQYDLYFDPAVLQVVNQTKGDFLTQDGASSMDIANTFNNTIGKVEYGEMRLGVQNGVTDPGMLAVITFNVTGCGSSDLTLSNVILSDPFAQQIAGVKINNSTFYGFMRGDIAPYPDGDCVVDMGDVIRLLNFIHDPEKYPVNEDLSDLDRDGEIDMGDVMLLVEYVVEQE